MPLASISSLLYRSAQGSGFALKYRRARLRAADVWTRRGSPLRGHRGHFLLRRHEQVGKPLKRCDLAMLTGDRSCLFQLLLYVIPHHLCCCQRRVPPKSVFKAARHSENAHQQYCACWDFQNTVRNPDKHVDFVDFTLLAYTRRSCKQASPTL